MLQILFIEKCVDVMSWVFSYCYLTLFPIVFGGLEGHIYVTINVVLELVFLDRFLTREDGIHQISPRTNSVFNFASCTNAVHRHGCPTW